jgi:hypothetical protein
MKKYSTRILAMLMCVLMCVSLLPLTALAAAAPEVVRESAGEKVSVVSNGKPKITTQPKSRSVKQGAKVTFKVAAKGSGLKYQWYCRKSSSGSWSKMSGKTTASLTLTVGRYNGYQYRCKVSNKSGSVTSKAATLKVDQIEYRALLVAETTFDTETEDDGFAARMAGDVLLMKDMLGKVKGAKGGKYKVSYEVDLTNEGIHSAIGSAFAGADSNDVSFFFISTHGISSLDSPHPYAGALATYGDGTENDLLKLSDLADWLSQVPGKVVVMIGSCGSGAAIYANGARRNTASDAAFTQAVVRAFAAKDSALPVDSTLPNTGEFRTNKFCVLTASAHMENSIGWESQTNDVSDSYNLFAAAIYDGCLLWDGSAYADADANKNKVITLNELYKYVCYICEDVIGPQIDYYQHTQVYPTNSSYPLFKTA